MKKIFFLILINFIFHSCIVATTATKVVSTAGKLAVGAVKTTVNGVNWTIQKANGKINENSLNGKWKVIGFYKGSFNEFSVQNNPINFFTCDMGIEIFDFKMKKEKFYHYPCGTDDPLQYKLKYSFEKNPETGDKENMITYGPSYFTIIDVDNQHLTLEGYFINIEGSKVKSIALFEKVK